ncbi:MAG: NIPSNAP family protein [Betaproteobacteria bacterium]
MMYELRIYQSMPGRLPDLNKRFETITLKLWDKHGIRQVGFWTVLVGDSNLDLYYILEWKDMAEREHAWNAFATDPEWLEKRAETERNGPLVAKINNLFLSPTQYSRIK